MLAHRLSIQLLAVSQRPVDIGDIDGRKGIVPTALARANHLPCALERSFSVTTLKQIRAGYQHLNTPE